MANVLKMLLHVGLRRAENAPLPSLFLQLTGQKENGGGLDGGTRDRDDGVGGLPQVLAQLLLLLAQQNDLILGKTIM